MPNQTHCKRCDIGISGLGKTGLCQKCWAKEYFSIPEHNTNYIDGRSLTVKQCKECGEIVGKETKSFLCSSCAVNEEKNTNYQN